VAETLRPAPNPADFPTAGRLSPRWALPVVIAVCAFLVLIAAAVTVGADTMWLVALGDRIADRGRLPRGFPLAVADTSSWFNVPVLGELTFAGAHRFGALGLPVTQLALDAATYVVLARGAVRSGASACASAVVLSVASLGILPALVVIRAQTLSLVPFCLLLVLLRSEHRSPSRRIWLLPGLIAVWGNLHGAVLVGVALACCYLVFSRSPRRPRSAILLLAMLPIAVCLNPAGPHSLSYYRGIFGNAAARRGSELWSSPSIHHPFDVVMLGAVLVLLVLFLLRRRPGWEYLAALGMAVATVSVARNGEFLILFLVAPASHALTLVTSRGPRAAGVLPLPADPVGRTQRVVAVVVCVAAVSGCALILNGARDRAIAHGQVVLTSEPLAEALAAHGVRVWMSDPIDAFSRADQQAYLDFLAGGGPAAGYALAQARFVVAGTATPPAALAAASGFIVRAVVDGYTVFARK